MKSKMKSILFSNWEIRRRRWCGRWGGGGDAEGGSGDGGDAEWGGGGDAEGVGGGGDGEGDDGEGGDGGDAEVVVGGDGEAEEDAGGVDEEEAQKEYAGGFFKKLLIVKSG